jgi:hypothetical protein
MLQNRECSGKAWRRPSFLPTASFTIDSIHLMIHLIHLSNLSNLSILSIHSTVQAARDSKGQRGQEQLSFTCKDLSYGMYLYIDMAPARRPAEP